jgi:hypothetical protein
MNGNEEWVAFITVEHDGVEKVQIRKKKVTDIN